MNLDLIVEKLTNRRFLTRLFVLWLVVNALGISVSMFFISNVSATSAQEYVDVVGAEYNEGYEINSVNTASTTNRVYDAYSMEIPRRLIIDKIGIDLPVRNPSTTDIKALDRELLQGAVRYPTSGLLGEDGKTTVLFGHSARIPTYRGMYRAFNDIETLKEGDTIAVQGDVKEYVYRVAKVKKANVNTGEIQIIANNNKLTLVTCDGFGKKSDRWIVEADLVGAYNF